MFRRDFLTTASAAVAGSLLRPCADGALPPNSPSQALRVAVIGHTGRGNYGHGLDTVWSTLPQTELVAVADADAAGLGAAEKRLKGTRAFADYRQMLAEIRPQIVAVAPRFVDEHHAMITASIEAGAKGVYVEKPFVRTPAEADDVVRGCHERGVRLAIAHRNRYHPALPVLADLLASGALGTPLEIRARGKEDQRGGALDLWVLGSHVLNLAVFLAGKPLACSGMAYQKGVPATELDIHEGDEGVGPLMGDAIHARFEMESGIPLFFDSKKGLGDPSANFGIQVLCTNGTVDLRIDKEPLIHVQMGNPLKPDTAPRSWIPLTSAGLGKAEPIQNIRQLIAGHQQPVLDLIASIETNRQPLCGPEDGRTIVEMIHSLFTSHIRGGARVPLPLVARGNPLKN